MNQEQIDQLKDLIDYERKRKSPPKDFPKLPDLPGKRYTDKEFFDLEKEKLQWWFWDAVKMSIFAPKLCGIEGIILFSDLDMDKLRVLHNEGSVRNLKDRRKDFYRLERVKK